ncbi:MAG: anti-sigma factor [Planctomycetota bacterium]
MADIGTATPIKAITCDECRDLLSEYVDREIDEPVRASIERHLTECTRCVTESTRLQGLKKIVRHWDGVKGTSKFRGAVMQQMIRESQQTQIPANKLAEATAAALEAKQGLPLDDDEPKEKPMPPVWVLIAAAALAALVYYAVLKLRGA